MPFVGVIIDLQNELAGTMFIAIIASMKVAFTIATANFLSQAKTVGDSLRAHQPGVNFTLQATVRIVMDPFPLW